MSCDNEEALNAYADGRGGSEERRALGAHLQSCADCRGQLRWLQAMRASLAALEAPPMPLELKAALTAEARAAAARKRARLRREAWARATAWARSGSAAGLGVAAGLAAAAVALVIVAGRPTDTVTLDDMLAAHRAYEMTMPLTSQETVLTGLADALAGGRP